MIPTPPHNVNLNIQLVPIADAATAYPIIDEVIKLIEATGLPYRVGAFGTAVEGNYAGLQQLVNTINSHLYDQGVQEWVLNLQWHIKSFAPVSIAAKIADR